MGLSINITVSDRVIIDQICAAIEGGIAYWANGYKPVGTAAHKAAAAQIYGFEPDAPDQTFDYAADPGWKYALPLAGGKLVFDVFEDKPASLDKAAIERGLVVLATEYPSRLAEILSESGDAETADVFVQCCLFGEVVYG